MQFTDISVASQAQMSRDQAGLTGLDRVCYDRVVSCISFNFDPFGLPFEICWFPCISSLLFVRLCVVCYLTFICTSILVAAICYWLRGLSIFFRRGGCNRCLPVENCRGYVLLFIAVLFYSNCCSLWTWQSISMWPSCSG